MPESQITARNTLASPPDRYWIERDNDDFPYYRGVPVEIGGAKWCLIVAAVAVSFFALISLQPLFPSGLASFLPAALYVAIPLAALALFAGGGWNALFRPMRGIDCLWIIVFFVLNWILTIVVGFVIVAFFAGHANPSGEIVAAASGAERVFFFLRTGVQLFGEELFTILPFLAILYWFTQLGMRRKTAVALGAVAVAFVFALIHLPTYQWNVPQALIGLVPIRVVLLLPYIMTKNIWVSTGVHVLNDWAIFGLPLLVDGDAGGD